MNNPANTPIVERVALCLLAIISRRAVTSAQLAEAAAYFSGTDTAADLGAFTQLVQVVKHDLPNNKALLELAANHQQQLGAQQFQNPAQAHEFIQQYIAAMGIGPLLSQPMTVGYARRMAGNPFDSRAIQSTGIRGWMMLYTVEGDGTLDTGVRQLAMRPGDAALFEPGSVFSYYRAANCDCWGHYWVAFHATEHWRSWLGWPRVGPNVGFLSSDNSQSDIEDSLKLLLQNYISPSPMATELNHNLLEQVILRCRNLAPGSGPSSIDPRIAKAQDYIAGHFNQSFSIEAVASVANLSLSGLAHLFKQQTGMTVLQWRDEKRMMHATWLLRTTKKPIGSIAAESGFEETPFFNRTFKRLIGYTPGEYRRR